MFSALHNTIPELRHKGGHWYGRQMLEKGTNIARTYFSLISVIELKNDTFSTVRVAISFDPGDGGAYSVYATLLT
jgi:hypothetical protein